MTPRHLALVALVVAGLALVWGVSALLPSGTDRPAADVRLPAVTPDAVDRVTIAGPSDTIVLTRRTPAGWLVNGFPASGAAVDELFAAVRDTTRPELVARSGVSFGRLGVDSTARRLTIAEQGRPVLELLVSDRSPDAGGAYVRRPDDSAVYAWPGRLAWIARRRVDDWRDRVIGAVPPDSIRRIELEWARRRYALTRDGGTWTLVQGARRSRADSGAVARLLEKLRSINASGFPSGAERDSAFRTRPERRLAVFGADDRALLALEFDSTDHAFWARRAREEMVYRVSTWDAEQLVPADSALRAPQAR